MGRFAYRLSALGAGGPFDRVRPQDLHICGERQLPVVKTLNSPPASFSPHFIGYNVLCYYIIESPEMPFDRDPFASSLMGRSALMRLAYVAVGIAVLWAAIGWAVALA